MQVGGKGVCVCVCGRGGRVDLGMHLASILEMGIHSKKYSYFILKLFLRWGHPNQGDGPGYPSKLSSWVIHKNYMGINKNLNYM